MIPDRLRRAGYGWLLVQGVVAALAPRLSFRLNRRLWGLALENAAAIEPRPWYVRAIRAGGVGMIAAGVAGLALERAAETGEQRPGESAPATGE